MARLSRPRWLVLLGDGLLTLRWLPILALTGSVQCNFVDRDKCITIKPNCQMPGDI